MGQRKKCNDKFDNEDKITHKFYNCTSLVVSSGSIPWVLGIPIK